MDMGINTFHIKRGLMRRLELIQAASIEGDKISYQKYVNSYVDNKGDIIFFEDLEQNNAKV